MGLAARCRTSPTSPSVDRRPSDALDAGLAADMAFGRPPPAMRAALAAGPVGAVARAGSRRRPRQMRAGRGRAAGAVADMGAVGASDRGMHVARSADRGAGADADRGLVVVGNGPSRTRPRRPRRCPRRRRCRSTSSTCASPCALASTPTAPDAPLWSTWPDMPSPTWTEPDAPIVVDCPTDPEAPA